MLENGRRGFLLGGKNMERKMLWTVIREWIWKAWFALFLAVTLAGCASEAEPDENSGLYEAVSAKTLGMEVGLDDVFDEPLTIELKDGGKAVFSYEGKDYNMKWTRSGRTFEAKGGGAELSGTLRDGVMEIEDVLDSGIDIRLECRSIIRKASRKGRDSKNGDTGEVTDGGNGIGIDPDPADTDGIPEDAMKVAEIFEGDWYGMVRVNHAYDGYSRHQDVEMYCTARFAFDEKGDVTAYLCSSIAPLASNFLNVTAHTSPTIESVVVSFDFFEGHTKDDVYFRVDRGLLNGVAQIANDAGDEMDISLALRRIGDEWTENEKTVYWKFAAQYAHLAVGETAETMADAWCDGDYPKPVPALTNISGKADAASAGPASGGTDAAGADTESASGGAGAATGTGADFDPDKRPSKLNGALIWEISDIDGEAVSDMDTLALAYRDAGSYTWYYEDWVAFIGTKGENISTQETDYGTFYHIWWYTPEGEYLDVAFEHTDEGFLKWNNTRASDGVYERYKALQ